MKKRRIKAGDWVYNTQLPWLIMLVHRVEEERQLLWDSTGRSIGLDAAVRLPASPHATATAWDRVVSAESKRYFRKAFLVRRYKKNSSGPKI